jgi:hypothetical protein
LKDVDVIFIENFFAAEQRYCMSPLPYQKWKFLFQMNFAVIIFVMFGVKAFGMAPCHCAYGDVITGDAYNPFCCDTCSA